MAAFATVEDLATFIKQDLSAPDAATASQMLDIATAAIQRYTGQLITKVINDVIVLDGPGRRVLILPELPVLAVDSVTVDGTLLTFDTDYTWSKSGILERGRTTWGTIRRSITVQYDHGYDPIPDGIKGACLWLSADLFQRSSSLSATSESIDGYSVAYQQQAADEAINALPGTVRMVLDSYCSPLVA